MNDSNNPTYFNYLLLLLIIIGCASCKSHHANVRNHAADADFNIKARKELYKNLSDQQRDLVCEAISWLGTPYRYGGNQKGKGSDCSGLVSKVYLDYADVKLPRSSAEQEKFCSKLKASKVKIGDLVFFATGKDPHKTSHVGIMVDDTHFVHASTSKGVVISDITTPYYQKTFRSFRRVPCKIKFK